MGALRKVGTAALAAGVLVLLVAAVAGAAAPPKLYKSTARSLLPSAAQAGYDTVSSQSPKPLTSHPKPGLLSSWSRVYERSGLVLPVESLGAMVYRTEASAHAQYADACSGCEAMRFHGWPMKRKSAPDTSTGENVITVIAQCRNVVLAATTSTRANLSATTPPLRAALDAIFSTAYARGMTPCGSAATPIPPTGTYYWSESEAEGLVVKLVKIPYCNAFPSDSGCAGQAPVHLQSATCTGADEKGTTFTYSRFTCEVVIYGGYAHGRIAVYPTGPQSLRWKLL
jgi:hypothetical protein